MDEEQRASYARQLQEATEALERKQQHLANLNDQYERDKTVARQEAEQASLEEQKQALTLQIEQMPNAEDERLLMTRRGQEMTEEEYQADRDRKLASIGGFQAERLRIEQEGAQQAYDALVERGQLTTQTQEEYDKELADADQQNLTAKKKINDAYVADEQAKQQAVGSVVRGLTGLLDTLGESNKTFAKMSKVITLAQIAIDTGKALSAGIASASSVPFPGNLVAIATTVPRS